MATFTTTAKHALRWLTGGNVVSDIDAGFQALAEDVDAVMATADAGALASRPVSTPGSPGKVGHLFYAIDTFQLFFDWGEGWFEIAPRYAVVAAFPTTGLYVGQVVFLQATGMATKGLAWPFRYKGPSGTYRWEAIGALSWFEKWRGTSAGAATITYDPIAAIGGVPVSINVPVAGTYLVRWGYKHSIPSSGVPAQESWLVPVAEPGDARTQSEMDLDAIHAGWITTNDAPVDMGGGSSECLVTVPVAGDPIWLEQRNGVTIAWAIVDPWMEIVPVACI